MKRFIPATALGVVLGLVLLPGPGSGGQEAKKGTPFAGNYSGPWTGMTTAGKRVGTMTLAVGADGKLTGTEKDATSGGEAKVTGAIREDGAITFVLEYPGARSRAEGTVTKTKNGHLKGTLIQYLDKDKLFAGYQIDLAPSQQKAEKGENGK